MRKPSLEECIVFLKNHPSPASSGNKYKASAEYLEKLAALEQKLEKYENLGTLSFQGKPHD